MANHLLLAYAVYVEPTTAIVGPSIQIVRLAWGGVLKGRDFYEAQQQIGIVVPAALRRALCGSNPSDESVKLAADAIVSRLQDEPITQQAESPPWWKRSYRLAKGRTRQLFRIKSVPPVTVFAHRTFDQQMATWLSRALLDDGIKYAIGKMSCPETHDATTLCRRFADSFFLELASADESKWRTGLLLGLREASLRDWWLWGETQKRRRSLAESAGVAASALAGAGVSAFGLDVATSGDPTAIAVGAAVAIGTGAGATVGAVVNNGLGRSHLSPPQMANRRAVQSWLAQLAATSGWERAPASTDDLRVWVHQTNLDGHLVSTSETLLADLRDRLITHANRTGDLSLEAALLSLEDGLIRARMHLAGVKPQEMSVLLLSAIDATETGEGSRVETVAEIAPASS